VVDDVVLILTSSENYFSSHHLVGYSFGSFIALQAANEKTISYTAITPPLNEHDFSALANLQLPKLIVLAENDNLLQSPKRDLLKHADKQEIIADTDHFFRKREMDIANVVSTFLLAQANTFLLI
jgi:alpha/beta superfamily hydrolase